MTALRTIVSAVLESLMPDGTLAGMRLRTSLDMVLTLVITVLAVVLTIGYQVLGRWARRSGWGQ